MVLYLIFCILFLVYLEFLNSHYIKFLIKQYLNNYSFLSNFLTIFWIFLFISCIFFKLIYLNYFSQRSYSDIFMAYFHCSFLVQYSNFYEYLFFLINSNIHLDYYFEIFLFIDRFINKYHYIRIILIIYFNSK